MEDHFCSKGFISYTFHLKPYPRSIYFRCLMGILTYTVYHLNHQGCVIRISRWENLQKKDPALSSFHCRLSPPLLFSPTCSFVALLFFFFFASHLKHSPSSSPTSSQRGLRQLALMSRLGCSTLCPCSMRSSLQVAVRGRVFVNYKSLWCLKWVDNLVSMTGEPCGASRPRHYSRCF